MNTRTLTVTSSSRIAPRSGTPAPQTKSRQELLRDFAYRGLTRQLSPRAQAIFNRRYGPALEAICS